MGKAPRERERREGKERREARRRRRIVSFEFEERTSGRPGGKRMGAWREGERESREGKERREARRRRRIVSFEFEEVRNFCCSKIVTHRFVRIRGAYVRQARGKAHGRVARRREGESRGKGKAGGAKKASHRFVRIRGGKEFLLLENSKNKTKVEARRRRRIVSFEF